MVFKGPADSVITDTSKQGLNLTFHLRDFMFFFEIFFEDYLNTFRSNLSWVFNTMISPFVVAFPDRDELKWNMYD